MAGLWHIFYIYFYLDNPYIYNSLRSGKMIREGEEKY